MTLKKIVNWVFSAVLVIALLVTLNLVVSTKINGGKSSLLGNQLMVVLSGSMSPTFNTGSVVAVKPVRFEEIKKGDIITFNDIDGRVVTHRVLEKQQNKLVTKGDANDAADSTPVASDRVIGKVSYSLPYVGYFVEFSKSKAGMLIFLVIPGVYLVLSQMWKLFRILTAEEKTEEKEKTAS